VSRSRGHRTMVVLVRSIGLDAGPRHRRITARRFFCSKEARVATERASASPRDWWRPPRKCIDGLRPTIASSTVRCRCRWTSPARCARAIVRELSPE
jgi:hypothetical protein